MTYHGTRHRFAVVLALALVSLITVGGFGTGLAQQSRSGGLGLTLDEWDTLFGPGQAGQSLMFYETESGATMYVGQDDGAVDSIQINLETSDSGAMTVDDAEALVASLLPNDADLEESFTAPVIAPGTYTIISEQWESDWLEDQFQGDREHFIVIYQQTGLEPLIASIAIIVED